MAKIKDDNFSVQFRQSRTNYWLVSIILSLKSIPWFVTDDKASLFR